MTELVRKYPILTIFICLQLIDFSTTRLGILCLGAHEQNMFVKLLIDFYGLTAALLLLKGLGILFGLHLGENNKNLRRACYIYGVVMCWNLGVIALRVSRIFI